MPELIGEELTLVALVADTSASTRRVLSAFLAELQSIIDDCQPRETVVIMADADVQSVTYFGRGESLKVQFIGFGGTDFRPAFSYIDTEQLDPACLIYLTDGEGTFPDHPPDYPTLWAITTPEIEAPWGVTISIDPSMAP
jgi:predicted metal-dependent peptidase